MSDRRTSRSYFRADARAPFVCAPPRPARNVWDARPLLLAIVLVCLDVPALTFLWSVL